MSDEFQSFIKVEPVTMDDHAMSDDDILHRNQGMRRRFVDHLTQNGFPEDAKDRYILLTALGDMDRTALANKKIGATERQGAEDRKAAIIAARITATFGSRNPFESQIPGHNVPLLDTTLLEPVTLAHGETEIGTAVETHDEFMARMDLVPGNTRIKT
jgi:hypothetical protein